MLQESLENYPPGLAILRGYIPVWTQPVQNGWFLCTIALFKAGCTSMYNVCTCIYIVCTCICNAHACFNQLSKQVFVANTVMQDWGISLSPLTQGRTRWGQSLSRRRWLQKYIIYMYIHIIYMSVHCIHIACSCIYLGGISMYEPCLYIMADSCWTCTIALFEPDSYAVQAKPQWHIP